ncbi:flagellar hook-basal body complex protein FliE [Shewanella sp. NFH-SH190041]|uniref:flagellar hook-basal body complex protein FliE n=1 Tax=Shewanella sp. NFH-SH190041 TaxID=2950245 RepID=UPI0021C29CF3|nr:flagellar hook-basal body complex protein FliE [Shewanella sp. NFH-SH190041]BDM62732.1 flagellar hook-basal body complex protein FliE [Shewanella sp. NFH-SH190041]
MSLSIQTASSQLQHTMQIQGDMAKGLIKPSAMAQDETNPVSFSALMEQKIASVNNDQLVSDALTRAVDTGESDDLVGAMVATQKASLSFDAMMQIRNRLMQAFDDIMKMPI